MASGLIHAKHPAVNSFKLETNRIVKGELQILTMVRRKTMGKHLEEARLALRMSLKDVQNRIAKEYGSEIGESTIRSAEKDRFPNPGIKTIELIARAVNLEPLDVIALKLDEPPSADQQSEALARGRFGLMVKLYEQLDPTRRVWYDEAINMLIEKMRKD